MAVAAILAPLYVLPIVLMFDALLHPSGAWRRLSRNRYRWVAVFAAVPLLGLETGTSYIAYAVAPFSIFYMARVRSQLGAATALELDTAGSRGLTVADLPRLEPLIFLGPVLAFLVLVGWRGDWGDRIVAAAIGLAACAAALAAAWAARKSR